MQAGFLPRVSRRAESRPPASAQVRVPMQLGTNEATMLRLVRLALGIGSSCRPLGDFTLDVLRYQVCGGAGLGHRYHSRFFCKVVIALAAEMIDEIQGRVHQQLLPALGVAADLELTSDGVSIQKTKAMPWGLSSIVLIGSVRSHHLIGESTSACVDLSNHGTDWRGFATTKLFMDKLASPPFRLGLNQLSARVAAFPGDGALCKGGPASRHPSSDMGGHLFRRLSRPDRSVWDLMLRLHRGGLRAIHQSSLMGEIVPVTKDLEIKLGFG